MQSSAAVLPMWQDTGVEAEQGRAIERMCTVRGHLVAPWREEDADGGGDLPSGDERLQHMSSPHLRQRITGTDGASIRMHDENGCTLHRLSATPTVRAADIVTTPAASLGEVVLIGSSDTEQGRHSPALLGSGTCAHLGRR